MKQQSGIYVYWFKNTGLNNCEQSYIGSAIDLKRRHKEHINVLIKNKHSNESFQMAYNTFGKGNMIYEQIEHIYFPDTYNTTIKTEYLEGREKMYYEELGSKYNKIVPGDSYFKSIAKKEGELYSRIKRTVYLVDSNLNILQEFRGLRVTQRELNISSASISRVANLKSKCTKKGLIFRFKETLNRFFIEDTTVKISSLKGTRREVGRRPILCYSLEGVFIKEYPAIIIASEELNIIESSINRCCTNEQSYAGDFIFRYKNSVIPVVSVTKKNIQSIVCYINNTLYKEYSNCNIASKDLNIKRNIIHYYCANKRTLNNKYQFKYNQ